MKKIQMYKRAQYSVLEKRMKQPRKFIQVLMGPRQTGKTTLIRQLLDIYRYPWHYVSGDDAMHPLWLQQQWEAARLKWRSSGAKEGLLVIDEIQKVGDWSKTVKALWDQDTFDRVPVKVVLLGSSQLLLQKGLSESMAGRFEPIFLPHWSFPEMNSAFGFTVEDYIWFGGYPGPAGLIHDEMRWKEYIRYSLIETTIMRDILLLTRIDKLALLRTLFDLACAWSGQILSYNKILGQLDDAGNTTTLAHYLHLIDGAGMIRGLEKHSPSVVRQRASSPKFQVYNNALMSALAVSGRKETEARPELYGRWVESSVGSHLLNLSFAQQAQLSYWREGNNEVDFVLTNGDKTTGIEVKSGRSKVTTGMTEFAKRFAPSKTMLVGGDGLTLREFFSIPLRDLLL